MPDWPEIGGCRAPARFGLCHLLRNSCLGSTLSILIWIGEDSSWNLSLGDNVLLSVKNQRIG